MNREHTLRDAVEASITTLGEHIQPGDKDCNATVNELLQALDNPEVKEAIEESHKEENNGKQ